MKKRKRVPRAVKGRGFVGCYHDGSLGWHVPGFVAAETGGRCMFGMGQRVMPRFADKMFYLCRISLTPLRDSLGRPITRTARALHIVEEES